MYSHRWHDSDRSSRQWDGFNDRREGKVPRGSHHKNSGAERMSRSKEYSSSLRQSSRVSLNRDWSRTSPARRRMTSPVWDASEKRSQRYSEDDDRDFRYKHESVEETCRMSSDGFSQNHKVSDFKHAPPHDDFKYRRTPPDFRSRHQREEFAHRQHEDVNETGFLDCFSEKKDRKRRWDCSAGKTQSPGRFTKIYTNTRDSPPTKVYQEDYHQNQDRVPLNGSSRQFCQSDAPQTATVPETKLSEGFQRFLNVLNKGVNVDALAKIVGQTSADISEEYVPQSCLVNAADHSWSPGHAEGQQKLQHNSSWRGSTATLRLESPQSDLQFFSPNREPASDDKVLQRPDGRDSLVEKISLRPEDEEKRKQMRDVLQAIGVDLGSEELGQMSHRIQERLYGKKDGDYSQRLDRDKGPRQAFTSRDRSRSLSSSRSSFSPMNRDSSFIKKDLCDTQRTQTDMQETQGRPLAEYSQKMSSGSFQDREDCKTSSQDWNVFSSMSTCSLLPLPPSLLIPTSSPISCSPLLYPTRSPAPPPISPHIGADIFLPRLPPLLSHPPVPPTMFPSQLAQTGCLLPPPPLLVGPPDVKTLQATNKTQKSKTLSRPRYLHVIK